MIKLAWGGALSALVFGVHQYDVMSAGSTVVVKNVFAAPIVHAEEFPPILQKICGCESNGCKEAKQFLPDGRVVRGHVNPSDIGMCQINEPIWNDTARKMGFDIYTEKGNRSMALWLFNHYGSEPWKNSKELWGKE